MFKTYAIIIFFTILGIIAFNYPFLNSSNNLTISEGLWVESSRNINFSFFSPEPFYFEKIPQKDLVVFNQLKDFRKSTESHGAKTYTLKRQKDDTSFIPIDLRPLYPCKLSGKIESDKLISKIQCSDKDDGGLKTGIITFTNTNKSLFNAELDDKNNGIEIHTLQNIAKIEQYNKEIYELKVNLKNITQTLKEGNLSEQMKATLSEKYGALLKENSTKDVNEKLKQLKSSLEEVELYRKAQLKVSNYGSEVELAARLNNIEWQRALKNWNVAIPASDQSLPSSVVPDAKPEHSPPLNSNEKKADTSASPIQNDESTNSNSWWKEF